MCKLFNDWLLSEVLLFDNTKSSYKYYELLIICTSVRDMANNAVCGLAHNSQCVGVIYLPLGSQRDQGPLCRIAQTGSLYVAVTRKYKRLLKSVQ